MDANAPPNECYPECPTPPINNGAGKTEKREATCDYDDIVWESEQLIAHDVYHYGAHRVVRYQEASVHHCRVVLIDATRYERDKHEVPI